ncbi:hypothetical protein Q7P37_002111 [Cladosporium fusiforme]
MSVSRARFGLLESKAASLSLLGRGQRPVRGRLLNDGRQLRMAWGWNRSWDDEPDDASAAEEKKRNNTTDKPPELEAYQRTTKHVRARGRGRAGGSRHLSPPGFAVRDDDGTVGQDTRDSDSSWSKHSRNNDRNVRPRSVHADRETVKFIPWGLNARLTSEAEAKAASGLDRTVDFGWSRATEDNYWDVTSRPLDADPSPVKSTKETPYGLTQEAHEDAEDGLDERGALLDVDYKVELPRALERGDAESIMHCLRAAETRVDVDYIQEISQEAFAQIMRILGAERHLGDLFHAAKDVSAHWARSMGLVDMEEAAHEYSWMLQNIAEVRRRSGHCLTKEQYLILLESARDLGLRHLAIRMWNFLHQDDIVPDIAMYNALLTTFVHAGRHNSAGSYHMRVIKSHMTARKEKSTDKFHSNYHIGEGGVRERSMIILDAMLKNGITGDEETYCAMITAAAKEGEIATVKSILRTIWHIDVDKLMAPDPETRGTMNPRKPAKDGAQYPSDKLLYALAHGFGINNSIPTALRLVDYISREYEITISQETWQVLFEWTFVLASRRSGTNAREDRMTGKLPVQSLHELWNTMTGPPYFVKPTMAMYNRMIKNLFQRNLHVEMLRKMLEASSLCDESWKHRGDALKMFMVCLEDQERGRRPEMPVTQARRSWEAAKIAHDCNLHWMKRSMRMFFQLFASSAKRSHRAVGWLYPLAFQTLPRVLMTWRRYAKSYIKYETPTGLVELQLRSDLEMLEYGENVSRFWENYNQLADRAKFSVGDDWVRRPAFENRRMREAREAREAAGEEAAGEQVAREAMLDGEPGAKSEGAFNVDVDHAGRP